MRQRQIKRAVVGSTGWQAMCRTVRPALTMTTATTTYLFASAGGQRKQLLLPLLFVFLVVSGILPQHKRGFPGSRHSTRLNKRKGERERGYKRNYGGRERWQTVTWPSHQGDHTRRGTCLLVCLSRTHIQHAHRQTDTDTQTSTHTDIHSLFLLSNPCFRTCIGRISCPCRYLPLSGVACSRSSAPSDPPLTGRAAASHCHRTPGGTSTMQL